jgi:hypothetical protein
MGHLLFPSYPRPCAPQFPLNFFFSFQQHRRSASQDFGSQRDAAAALHTGKGASAAGSGGRGLKPTSSAAGESKLTSKVKFLETHVAELTETIKV